MIKRGTLIQDIPSSLWEVSSLPDGAKRVRPLAAYDANGDSHEWDSWELSGGVLKVSFGVDPVAGELEYEYQVDGSDSVVVSDDGNSVSITINQYRGQPQSQP